MSVGVETNRIDESYLMAFRSIGTLAGDVLAKVEKRAGAIPATISAADQSGGYGQPPAPAAVEAHRLSDEGGRKPDGIGKRAGSGSDLARPSEGRRQQEERSERPSNRHRMVTELRLIADTGMRRVKPPKGLPSPSLRRPVLVVVGGHG